MNASSRAFAGNIKGMMMMEHILPLKTGVMKAGFDKIKAFALIDEVAAELRDLRKFINGLPAVLSEDDDNNFLDAFDCARTADDLAKKLAGLPALLGFEIFTP
jgi:hypothetical protein